jgi:hypothetical protein
MWRRWTCWLAAVLLISACSHGTLTRVTRTDGTAIVGELTAARPDAVVLKLADGSTITIPRSIIRTIEAADTPAPTVASNATPPPGNKPVTPTGGGNAGGANPSQGNGINPSRGGNPASGGTSAAPASGGASSAASGSNAAGASPARGGTTSGSAAGASAGKASAPSANSTPTVAHDTVAPSGTTLELSLSTPIGSDTSAVDDKVDAVLRTPLMVNGEALLEPGVLAHGTIVEATPSSKADGRGRLVVRFDTLEIGTRTLPIQTAPVRWEAPGVTKRPPPQESKGGFFRKVVDKTKKGLRIKDDDANSPRGSAEIRLAPGAQLHIRLEQAARIAP